MGLPQSLISTLGSLISALADLFAAISGDSKMVVKPGTIHKVLCRAGDTETTTTTSPSTLTCEDLNNEGTSPNPKLDSTLKEECVNIYKNSDIYLSVPELIQKYGFPFESHRVVTEDGYILNLFRIPHGRKGQRLCSRPPVLLMHGFLNSSSAWIMHTPEKALAYLLADQGYDIWMANSRGSIYSKEHERLSIKDKEYWDFSFHEMGKWDIPALINHILKTTSHPNLYYIGHSLGNTILMIAMSINPKISEQIKYLIAFAPAVYLYMTTSKLLSIPSIFSQKQKTVLDYLTGNGEFMPKTFVQTLNSFPFVPNPEYLACKCITASMITVGGYNPEQIYWPQLPVVAGHTPSSSSVRTYIHLLQFFNSSEFKQFDFGNPEMNENVYNQPTPLKYDLSKVTCPTVLFWASNDLVCRPEAVGRLACELPNVISSNRVPCEKFSHTDFLYSKDIDVLLYNNVIEILDSCK